MMGYDGYGMMGGGGFFGPLLAVIVIADLVLVGIWLWQQISKK